MSTAKLGFSIGVLLILAGVLIPSTMLISSLRTFPVDDRDQLLLGATIFKAGLVILGFFAIALGRMSIWKSDSAGENFIVDPHRKSHLFILAAILVAASALRLYGLNAGLWHDEILTYVRYVRMPFGEIISTYRDQNQHFLYTILAHACFWAFGEGAWSLRLPAVFFGIGSIWALYLLGRQVSSAREALLAAALLAFSYHHVWFSQNARGYTGLLFWTVLASWLFLRALHEARPHLWLLYAGAAALGIYTHLTMLFVIVSHFIVYLAALWARRNDLWADRWSGLFLGFCLGALFTLQLHALVLPQLFGGVAGEESAVPAWTHPLWTLLEFVQAMKIGFAGSLIAGMALIVFGMGVFSYARTQPAVIQLLFIPTILCASLVIGMGHHLWPRFFFFAVGFGALVVVRGTVLFGQALARLLNLPAAKSVTVGTTLCVGLIFASALSVFSAYNPKQDYLGALHFVEEHKQPGDAVVTVGLATFTYKNFYKMDWEVVKTVSDLNAVRSRSKRTWLLYTFPPHVEAVYPEIMQSIRHDFKVLARFPGTVGGGTIFIYRSEAPAVLSSSTAF